MRCLLFLLIMVQLYVRMKRVSRANHSLDVLSWAFWIVAALGAYHSLGVFWIVAATRADQTLDVFLFVIPLCRNRLLVKFLISNQS